MAKLLWAYPALPPVCVGYARLCRSGGFQRRHILFFPFHRQWLELAGLVVEHPQHAFGDIEQGALQVQSLPSKAASLCSARNKELKP